LKGLFLVRYMRRRVIILIEFSVIVNKKQFKAELIPWNYNFLYNDGMSDLLCFLEFLVDMNIFQRIPLE